MEKNFYRSKVLVKNAKTGEDVPKWELEEEHHSDGSRYFIHYYCEQPFSVRQQTFAVSFGESPRAHSEAAR